MGDVSTDSDWWGNSATPCSLAAGHGLISLDESHWHLSYLNDYVYLSISPPPSSHLSPSPWPCSRILPQFRDHGGVHVHTLVGWHRSGRVRRSSGREWVFTAGGPLASRSEARFRSKWKYFFYWRQTRGSGEWLTKAASRCQRSKHHTNRNTPVTPRNVSLWKRLHETSLWDIHLNGKKSN